MNPFSFFRKKPAPKVISPEEQLASLKLDLRQRLHAIDQAILLQAGVVCDALHAAELNTEKRAEADVAQQEYKQLVDSKQDVLVSAYRRLKDIQATLDAARRKEFQAMAMESLQEFKFKEALGADELKAEALKAQDNAAARFRVGQG